MNCNEWEKRIALNVEGDLTARETRAVTEHLAGCEGCRRFSEELMASQSMLKATGMEISAEAYGAVRSRVLAQVEGRVSEARSRRWLVWIPAGTGLAAAAVMVLLHLQNSPPTANPSLTVGARNVGAREIGARKLSTESITKADLEPVESRVRRRAHTRHREGRPPVMFARAIVKPEPLVIKMVTDDPEVVIIWLVDQKEGS